MSGVDCGVILAGGRSSRLGRDKALLRLGNETFLERAVKLLSARFDRVLVSLAESSSEELGRAAEDLELVRDLRPANAGPLAAIEAGLSEPHTAVFFLAVDMVLVDHVVVDRIVAAFEERAALGVMPSTNRGPEPLCAVYSASLLPEISARLDRGDRKARGLVQVDGIQSIPTSDLGVGEEAFLSVNTALEYEAVTAKLGF